MGIAVPDPDGPGGKLLHLGIMGHHDNGMPIAVQRFEQSHVLASKICPLFIGNGIKIQGIIFKLTTAFWGYTAFSYGLIFWATAILIKAFVSSKDLYRKQLTAIIASVMAFLIFYTCSAFRRSKT